MDRAEYNLMKEDFVSNLNGTSPFKILTLTHLFSITVPIRGCLITLLTSLTTVNSVQVFHMDFLFLIVPCILFTTVLGNYLVEASFILITILVCAILYSKKKDYYPRKDFHPIKVHQKYDASFAAFNCRVLLNVVTAISILSVDFHSFPREFAKAEWYGTGLMDVGVGSFIFANSYVSKWSRLPGKPETLVVTLRQAFFSSLSLIVIGIVRMGAVVLFSYHTHVSEYGVHWNFFITLSVVNLTTSIFFYCFNSVVVLSLIVTFLSLFHQYGLSLTTDFMKTNNNRSSLVLANLEGLLSLPGFFCLALFGGVYGCYLFQSLEKKHFESKLSAITKIFVIFAILTYALNGLIEPICRATVNLSYISWMVCYNVHMFFATQCNYYLLSRFDGAIPRRNIDFFFGRCSSCSNRRTIEICGCLFTKIAKNQLLFFLAGNVVTGLVNISIDTLRVGNFESFCIITVYMYFLCGLLFLKTKLEPTKK